MVVEIRVGDVMSRGLITAKKKDSIEKISQIMKKANIKAVTITERGKLVGMITMKDVIMKVLAEGKDYKKTIAEQIMGTPVVTADVTEDLEDVIKKMRDLDIERIPITSKGKPVGVVTSKDVVKMQPALLELTRQRRGVLEIGLKMGRETAISGECEICGNYSEYLRNVDGQLVCEDCR